MKKITIAIFALLFTACSSTSPREIKTQKVTDHNKLNALNFAKQQFEGCKTGKFAKLTIETSTPYLIKNLTEKDMKDACEKINKDCGDLQELHLIQILHEKRGYIYRFKAKYSQTSCEPEIRVYTNPNHKFDGLIYKPTWQDKYTLYP